jgi:hypothetical protein
LSVNLTEIKEMVGAGIKSNKFELSDSEINIDTNRVKQDFDNRILTLTRYLTSVHVVLNNPGTLTITVGNLNITYNGIHTVNLVGMSDLYDDGGNEIVKADIEYQASHITVTEKLATKEEK